MNNLSDYLTCLFIIELNNCGVMCVAYFTASAQKTQKIAKNIKLYLKKTGENYMKHISTVFILTK